jgi:ATP-dependent RNA helicase DHX29
MAPNKKKKKAASNPARGFATVSTASKTKEQDINEAQLEDQCDTPGKVVRSAPNEDGVLVSGGSFTVKSETTLQDLSPEELESRLEDSSLQSLVDTYREKTKKDVSRQASRIRTERRVLRSQAEHLSTQHWLPLEIMQIITDLIEMQQKSSSGPQTTSGAKDRALDLTEDDLIVKLWTLKRLLPELGFSDGSTQLALRHLLDERKDRDSNPVPISKDSIWGLDECLDWLALTSAPGELPSFLSQDAGKAQQRPQEGSRSGFTEVG